MAKAKAAPKTAKRANTEKPAEPHTTGPRKSPEGTVYIGQSVKPEYIWLRLANRHGLITGATGTGKTVTLQGLAESFSDAGVPVFCADVKGDLSGVAETGEPKGWIEDRAKQIGLHVGAEHRHAGVGEAFGEALQGDGLAGAGGAGDEPVPVGEAQPYIFGLDALPDIDGPFGTLAWARCLGLGRRFHIRAFSRLRRRFCLGHRHPLVSLAIL